MHTHTHVRALTGDWIGSLHLHCRGLGHFSICAGQGNTGNHTHTPNTSSISSLTASGLQKMKAHFRRKQPSPQHCLSEMFLKSDLANVFYCNTLIMLISLCACVTHHQARPALSSHSSMFLWCSIVLHVYIYIHINYKKNLYRLTSSYRPAWYALKPLI